MNQKIIYAIVAMLLPLFASAVDVTGRVVATNSEPEAYATVRMFAVEDSTKTVAHSVTDDSGAFALQIESKGDYRLIVSSVGKRSIDRPVVVSSSNVDLGVIVIEDAAEQLGEVEVVARKPLVKKEIDRIGYDVQADEDSKTATVEEILRKVPMVSIDGDGTIKIKGSTDFKIYKNGRPNNSFTNNAKDIFKAIPASMIKKIEVITDPGAREDAEGVGAILNIVTIENSSIAGVMGNVSASMNTNNAYPQANAFITSNFGKLAISANGGYVNQSRKMSHQSTHTTQNFVQTGNSLVSDSETETYGNIGFWGLEGSYELDSLNLFTLEFGGFSYGVKADQTASASMFSPTNELIYKYTANSYLPSVTYLDFNGNFNYQRLTRLKGESITLSYQISNNNNNTDSETSYSDVVNFPASYDGINTLQKLHFLEQTAQIDWTRPIATHSVFSLGGKFIHRKNHSNTTNEYVGENTTHSDFNHLTTIAAAYFDYRLSLGKWNARAGLRYEYSRLRAKFLDQSQPDFASHLNDWVPNASVMYVINDANTIKASFSTRINRPGISFLNPNVTVYPNSESSGNPDLKSIHYRSVDLNYAYHSMKFNLDATLSYSFANNTISSVCKVDENDYSVTTYGNVGSSRALQLSLFAQWNISTKSSLMLNFSGGHKRLTIPDVENSRWGGDAYLRYAQTLPWKLRLEAYLYYRHGELNDVYSYTEGVIGSLMHGLSLQRSFLKEDRLTVRLQAMNPIAFNNGMRWSIVNDRGDYTGRSLTQMDGTSYISATVSYRFGSVKGMVKKTKVEISNDDLQGGTSAPSTNGGM